jgi:hypothetical protein
MLDEAARWDDLVTGLRPMSYGAKGVPARCLVSVGPMTTAKASSEGWRLRLRPNMWMMDSNFLSCLTCAKKSCLSQNEHWLVLKCVLPLEVCGDSSSQHGQVGDARANPC